MSSPSAAEHSISLNAYALHEAVEERAVGLTCFGGWDGESILNLR